MKASRLAELCAEALQADGLVRLVVPLAHLLGHSRVSLLPDGTGPVGTWCSSGDQGVTAAWSAAEVLTWMDAERLVDVSLGPEGELRVEVDDKEDEAE